MIVRTPAIKLGVEVRSASLQDGRITLAGVAGAMPCTVELKPAEALRLARLLARPAILRAIAGAALGRSESA